MTLKELTEKVKNAQLLSDVFPIDINSDFKKFMLIAHPDKGGTTELFSQLVQWHNDHKNNPDWKTVRVSKNSLSGLQIKFPHGNEVVGKLIRENKVYRIYVNDDGIYICVPKSPSFNDLIENEVNTLNTIHKYTNSAKEDFVRIMKFYFPRVKGVTTLNSGNKSYKVFAFTHPKGEPYSIGDILDKHTKGIEIDHVSWIFRRFLLCLEYLKLVGIKHNCIDFDSLWVDDINHGVIITNFSNAGKTPKYKVKKGFEKSDLENLITAMSILTLDHQQDTFDARIKSITRATKFPNISPFDLHEKYGDLLPDKIYKDLKI